MSVDEKIVVMSLKDVDFLKSFRTGVELGVCGSSDG